VQAGVEGLHGRQRARPQGLFPAAISTGIGAQAQQPLARVVVGAMITTAVAIFVLISIFARSRVGPCEITSTARVRVRPERPFSVRVRLL
jgi:hypothetical protein